MFGWFKRQDGFEWRNYVRTTILVRREKRRQKIDEARAAAVDSLKDAGRKGAEIGAAGVAAAGRSAQSAGAGVWDIVKRALGGFGSQIADAGRAAGSRLRSGMAGRQLPRIPLAGLKEMRLTLPLAVVAAIAATGAAMRVMSQGFDQQAAIASGVAAAALLGLALAQGGDVLRWLNPAGAWLRERMPDFSALTDRLPDVPRRTLMTGGTIAGLSSLLLIGAWLTPGIDVPGKAASTAAVATGSLSAANGQRLEGRAIIKSGDTLRIDGTTVRLGGIEAPDRDQTCQRVGGKPWRCGQAAAEVLTRLTRGKDVVCDLGKADSAGVPIAACRAGDVDLADQLVRNGHVFAETGMFATYSSAESAARNAKAGVWSGEIERPSAYRAKRWEEARRSAPDGCPIKGQVTSGTRVYVLPWSASYERIKIRTGRGERWFCSEKEALEAGWKPVERS